MSDNNFMKVTKERNPYLKRVFSNDGHKYSYDINSGKYHLLAEDGTQTVITKIGTFTPKFRKNFTGFATAQQRYEAAKYDQTALHYTPDLGYKTTNSYYTPMTKKFMGYAQQPYKLKGKKFPEFLSKSQEPHEYKTNRTLIKSQSEDKQKLKTKNRTSNSLILEHSSNSLVSKGLDDQYFQLSFTNMTDSKPLPKFQKKTCYNYRCKYMKHYVFDEKGKTEASTKFANTRSTLNENTLSQSFYDKHFAMQKKELACIESQRV